MAKSLKETLGYNTKTITSLFDNNAAIRRQQQKFVCFVTCRSQHSKCLSIIFLLSVFFPVSIKLNHYLKMIDSNLLVYSTSTIVFFIHYFHNSLNKTAFFSLLVDSLIHFHFNAFTWSFFSIYYHYGYITFLHIQHWIWRSKHWKKTSFFD